MIELLENVIIKKWPTGSRYICNPPVTDTDNDTVALVEKGYENCFMSCGWSSSCTDVEYDTEGLFRSWRNGDENYIVTTDEEFYNRFVKATELAKKLNLLNRSDRVLLFQSILYDT